MLERYRKARLNVKDPARIAEAIVPLVQYFRQLPPEKLQDQDFRDYAAWRQRSNGTVRKEIGVLRSACNLAGVPIKPWMPPKTAPRHQFLTREESQSLLRAARSEHIRLFVLIALATGARKTSILLLPWDQVDLARCVIDFNEPGREITKKRRAVSPIGRRLAAALRDARQSAMTEFVIEYDGKPVGNVKHAFRRTAERAGVPWCTPHHLKHTAISWMAEDGWTVDQIADMTQTDPETVRSIYRKFNPEYLRGIAESQEGRLFDVALDHRRKRPDPKSGR